jgi:uncharacterized protein YjdB
MRRFGICITNVVLWTAVFLGIGCASLASNPDPSNPHGRPPTPAPDPAISVTISPATSSLQTGQTQLFTASVLNDSQNKGVIWSVVGSSCQGASCGSLSALASASGAAVTYTAPSQALPSPIVVTATSAADNTRSASATVTVSAAVGIIVAVSPATANLTVGRTQTFTATVQNDKQNQGVTWTLSGAGCTGAACGTLSAASSSATSVVYTAPGAAPNPATVTLTASSVSDPTKSAAAIIAIQAPPAPTVTVSVSPQSQMVAVGQSHEFVAKVQNDSQKKGVNWKLSGSGCTGTACGTLSASSSASGTPITYTAPKAVPNPGQVTLMATSVVDNSVSATSSITIFAIPSNLSVTLTPERGGLTVSQTLHFTATVKNDPSNQGVTWTSSAGTFTHMSSASATYQAPATAGVYKITAASVIDPLKTASATIGVTDLTGITTYHDNAARDGVNSHEYALTPGNVHASSFGKLFSCTVDAPVYAQPLWVANLSIHGGVHNVLFAATVYNTVYAFDADANPCVTYWSKHLIPSGETWVSAADLGSSDIQPGVGIVGTPVIDTTSNTLYLLARTENQGTQCRPAANCHQRLHALRLSDGSETSAGPVEISDSITVPGSGNGSNGTTLPFDPLRENQRPSLALVDGLVFVAWGSHTDQSPWHGWLMGFNKSNLQAAPVVYNTSPNGEGGGIWMGGAAPSVDSANNLYVITGNGDYDGNTEFGDTFLKLSAKLSLLDWMTPSDESIMQTSNGDFGAGGAAVLADLPSGPVRHLIIGGGKTGSGYEGELYVLNRDAMGHLEGSGSPIVQKFPVNNEVYATSAFWNNTIFIAGQGGPLLAFSLDSSTAQFTTTPSSRSSVIFHERGATTSISSNSGSHAIAWALDISTSPGPAILHAFDATNLGKELWNSGQASGNQDQAGGGVKFSVPTVANGKVYIGTVSEIDVYGLLPE